MMARLKKVFARPPLGMMIYLFVLANFLHSTYLVAPLLIISPLYQTPPSQRHSFADQPTAYLALELHIHFAAHDSLAQPALHPHSHIHSTSHTPHTITANPVRPRTFT